MAERVEPLMFDLCYRKQVRNRMGGVWVTEENEDELKKVPDVPPGFAPLRGFHGEVARKANELNNAQERSGFTRYFFFPEVAPMAKAGS